MLKTKIAVLFLFLMLSCVSGQIKSGSGQLSGVTCEAGQELKVRNGYWVIIRDLEGNPFQVEGQNETISGGRSLTCESIDQGGAFNKCKLDDGRTVTIRFNPSWFTCGGASAPISIGPYPSAGGKQIGVNVMHLLDEGDYSNAGPSGKPFWQETLDNAQRLGASFIRVTASYQPSNLGRADQMSATLCGMWNYKPSLKFLVAISEKSLEGNRFGSKLEVMRAWSRGEGRSSDHWQYTERFVSRVNSQCPGAIFAWEPGNEILCKECYRPDGGPAGGLSVEESRNRYKDYENFLIGYTNALRSLTSSQPAQKIGLGIIRVSWASQFMEGGVATDGVRNSNFSNSAEMFAVNPNLGIDWIKVFSQPAISFITIHPYGLPGDVSPFIYDWPGMFNSDFRIAQITGKPIMMEEFGATPASTGPQHGDPGAEKRAKSFEYWVNWAKSMGVRYIAPWQATEYVGYNAAGMSWHSGSCLRDPANESTFRCKIERAVQSFLN